VPVRLAPDPITASASNALATLGNDPIEAQFTSRGLEIIDVEAAFSGTDFDDSDQDGIPNNVEKICAWTSLRDRQRPLGPGHQASTRRPSISGHSDNCWTSTRGVVAVTRNQRTRGGEEIGPGMGGATGGRSLSHPRRTMSGMSLFSSPPPELSAATAAGTAFAPAIDPADHPPLRGRGLRWVLLDELKRHTQLSVAAMARTLADHGFDLGPSRASKLISDALRWEVRRGRITRPSRTILAQLSRDWITAVRSQRTPPPFPQTWRHRKHPGIPIPPTSPPWTVYGWLWNT